MRIVGFGALVVLAACGPTPVHTVGEPIPVAPAAPVTQDASVHGPRSESFDSPPERVWSALGRAYAAVGLKVNGIDTVTRTMGFAGILRGKIGGTRMSTFFDCGNQMGPNADTYDITLYVATQVASNPQTRRILVTTGLRVSGQSPAFATTKSGCTTKGELERRIMDALRKELEK